MFTKAVAISSIAALAGQALAVNAHRHLHQVDKRAVVTDWVTVWETVYVTPGQEFVQNVRPTTPCPDTTTTITSTSTVVVPSSTTTSEAPYQPPPPPPKPSTTPGTTLTTAIRPSAPPSSSSPAPPAPPAPQPTTTQAPPPPPPPPATSASQAPSIQAVSPAPAPSQPAASKPPSSGALFSSKRGMAYNDGTLANLFGDSCETCTWGYNWGSSSSGLSSKFSYVPMLWSPAPEHSDNWDSMAEAAIASGSKALLSFNECDNAGQCNMAPAAAAAAHAQYMNKYAGRARVGSPSITNSQSPGEGIQWLQAFMSACASQPGGCQVDFCTAHWYSPASAADTLFDHLEATHKACNNQCVMLTEFAPFGSNDEIADFLKTVIPKLEALDYVCGYSYFMVSADSLMSSATSLSSFGEVYASI